MGDRLATIDMGENWGSNAPLFFFWGGAAGSPCNTMLPRPRPICVPSFILIPPNVWLQYTNVTDRTDRQRDKTGKHRANRFANGRPKMDSSMSEL